MKKNQRKQAHMEGDPTIGMRSLVHRRSAATQRRSGRIAPPTLSSGHSAKSLKLPETAAEKTLRQTQAILSLENAITSAVNKAVAPYNAKIAALDEELDRNRLQNEELDRSKQLLGKQLASCGSNGNRALKALQTNIRDARLQLQKTDTVYNEVRMQVAGAAARVAMLQERGEAGGQQQIKRVSFDGILNLSVILNKIAPC